MNNRSDLYRIESIEIDVTWDKFILENYSGHHAIFHHVVNTGRTTVCRQNTNKRRSIIF